MTQSSVPLLTSTTLGTYVHIHVYSMYVQLYVCMYYSIYVYILLMESLNRCYVTLATNCYTHYHIYLFHFVLFKFKVWLLSNIQQICLHAYDIEAY